MESETQGLGLGLVTYEFELNDFRISLPGLGLGESGLGLATVLLENISAS